MSLPRLIASYITDGPDGTPIRVMDVDGAYQSATFLDDRRFEAPFSYLRSFEVIFRAHHPIKRVLMLGGGGFAYPKHLLAHHDDVSIDVVEISSAVIRIAKRRFFLDEALERFGDRLNIIEGDARAFLCTTQRSYDATYDALYDAIINDLFVGCEQNSFFVSAEGNRLAKEHLVQGGIYVSNVVVSDEPEAAARLARAVDAAGEVFNYVSAVAVTESDYASDENYLVIASDEAF